MENWLLPVIAIIAAMVIISLLSNKKKTKSKNESPNNESAIDRYPYKKVNVMTETEKIFFKQAKAEIPNSYTLLSKVRLWDIMECTETKNNYTYTNKIRSKHVDFLVIDKEAEPIIGIEINDKTHTRKDREERDEFVQKAFEAAQIKLIKLSPKNMYDMNLILSELENTKKEEVKQTDKIEI